MQDIYTRYKIPTLQLKIRKVPTGFVIVPELARIMERGGGLDGYGKGEEEDLDEDVPMST
jgi:hypothetical protein